MHLALSIHPTYRSTTSPFNLLPSGHPWRSSSWNESPQYPPDSAVPLSGQLPTANDLKDAANAEALLHRRRANAVFVVLARNKDLWTLLDSMRQLEDRFNHWARYDYVFLNEEVSLDNPLSLRPRTLMRAFDCEVSSSSRRLTPSYTAAIASGNCHYGKIRPDDWYQPDWSVEW